MRPRGFKSSVYLLKVAFDALRGFAVMLSLYGTPGLFGVVFSLIIFVFLYPIVMATTLMVGLTDTWLDLRARQRNEKP